MRFSNALRAVIITFSSWNVCASNKDSMSGTDAIAAAAAREPAAARELAGSSSSNNNNDYEYKRNYITIIKPDDFVSTDPNGATAGERIFQITMAMTVPTSIGTSIIQNGKIYDPADIVIVNKPNGIEVGDFGVDFSTTIPADALIGQRYAGDRQPKSPIPVGDSAYFFHGECVANSALPFQGEFPNVARNRELTISDFGFLDQAFVITSHTCLLNLCLGGGGFDCIAIYAGTGYVYNFGDQLNLLAAGTNLIRVTPTLPPPYPATIIGGTGSFEGIEGTVQIATIAGSAGAYFDVLQGPLGGLQRFGFIVQSISVTSNMPLPSAP